MSRIAIGADGAPEPATAFAEESAGTAGRPRRRRERAVFRVLLRAVPTSCACRRRWGRRRSTSRTRPPISSPIPTNIAFDGHRPLHGQSRALAHHPDRGGHAGPAPWGRRATGHDSTGPDMGSPARLPRWRRRRRSTTPPMIVWERSRWRASSPTRSPNLHPATTSSFLDIRTWARPSPTTAWCRRGMVPAGGTGAGGRGHRRSGLRQLRRRAKALGPAAGCRDAGDGPRSDPHRGNRPTPGRRRARRATRPVAPVAGRPAQPS